MHGIFISYRHDDAKAWAALLAQELVASFSAEQVYLDKDSQRAGPWRNQVNAALARSKVVLVVMGPRWLTAAAPSGERLLDDPQDVHRQEIAVALSSPGVTVIPVRMDGAPKPTAQDLSPDIRGLVDQQWRDISDVSVHRALDFSMLIEDIEKATGLVARKSAPARRGWRHQVRRLALAAVLTAFVPTFGQLALDWQQPMGAAELLVVFVVVLLMLHFGVWALGALKGKRL